MVRTAKSAPYLGNVGFTSKGAHGIPGSAIVVLAATLTAVPSIPVLGVAIILSVDKLMGFFRIALNLVGNCVGAVAIARWEGHLDLEKAKRVLSGEDAYTDPTRQAAKAETQGIAQAN